MLRRLRALWEIFYTRTVFARKPCPRCAEDVYADAEVCRYCGHKFEGSPD